MAEAGGELHLALEARHALLARLLGGQELHRRGPAQHGVAGAIDDAHASLAQLLAQRVLPELARLPDLASQSVDDAGDADGQGGGEAPPDRGGDGDHARELDRGRRQGRRAAGAQQALVRSQVRDVGADDQRNADATLRTSVRRALLGT